MSNTDKPTKREEIEQILEDMLKEIDTKKERKKRLEELTNKPIK